VSLEWDPAKEARNIARRGIPFAIVERLDWETALTNEDPGDDYGERRFFTLGMIDTALYAVVWTPRGDALRIISVRRATPKERRRYEAQA